MTSRDAEPSPGLAPPLRATWMGPAVPKMMRWTLVASIATAVLSSAVALSVLLRSPAPEPAANLEASSRSDPEPAAAPAPASTVPARVDASIDEAAVGTEAPADTPWPDLRMGTLPPVGTAPEHLGQSVGSPRDGALVRPTQFPPGRGYVVRNADTAWATDNLIEHVRTAIRKVHRKHPGLDPILIGDISTRRGGPLSGHASHQSGRDLDLGLIYRGHFEIEPLEFLEATHTNIDRKATYDLIAALAETRDQPTGVTLIVLDYGLQRILRRAAAGRGVPEEQLEALFQFPHGPTSRHGLVRHKPGHRDHMHVRFGCPKDDAFCRDPLIGFGGTEASEEWSTTTPDI